MKYVLICYTLPMAIMLCYEIRAIVNAQQRGLMIRIRFWPIFCRCCIPALNLWLAMWLLLFDVNDLMEKLTKEKGTRI